ncbi:MAG: TldE/PmbA family protein [Gemmatimonadetes bacterium]|nr:TldE/PmbA family protein [Gemmatimonadota bacterium]MBT6149558.1 TldE/PmbA family protein [Gemmatimonadota bacterium]MBT7861038.1 TldE/PmbA family protein [Gemmatimonadota bacterium]
MKSDFYELADEACAKVTGNEVLLLNFSSEETDFVRFNHSKVRQPGHVQQRYLTMQLIDGQRHTSVQITLTGAHECRNGRDVSVDSHRTCALLDFMRERLAQLPEDPHLLYNTEPVSSDVESENMLPPADEIVSQILAAGAGHDLVGILAMGGIYRGFANSLGQRNWFASHSVNFDWSFYLQADKAVKCGYAGTQWNAADFQAKVDDALVQLATLEREPRTIPPGDYRVYLAPGALADVVGMLNWGGLGLKSHRTKGTSLLRMITDDARLHHGVHLCDNTADGVAANFQMQGYLKPDQVPLITAGAHAECLISPRSAREYGVETNGADDSEGAASMDLAAGDIPMAEVLERLGTGVYINNVWYLNYSDRPACRITGMTRFACFWVEDGQILAPINVMRFDETLFRALGENLIGLTQEREMILDAGSYGRRVTSSARFPGALVEGFHFNL